MQRHVDISRFLVNGLLAVGCGALAWRMLALGDAMGWLFAVLAAACAIALARRWGGIVPCVTIGLVIGILSDATVKSGTAESQMWETAEAWIGGALIGVLVGVAMDWYQRSSIGHADKQAAGLSEDEYE
jgi:hypothetical protein